MNRRSDRAAALVAFERAAALAPDFAAPHYYLCQLYNEYMDGREPDRERAMAEGEIFLKLASSHDPADREAMLRTLERLVSGGEQLLISSRAPVGGPRATPQQRLAWREQQVALGGLERYGQGLVGACVDVQEFDRALATCDAMLALDLPADRTAQFRATWLWTLIRAGLWEDELAARERAAAERPDDPSAYLALADIYDGLGRTRAAVKALRRAVALEPNDLDAHLRLADLYRRLGWRSLIETECLEALRIDPRNRRAADMLVPHGWGSLRGGFGAMVSPGGVGAMDLDILLPVLAALGDSEPLARLADGYLYRGDTDAAIRIARLALETGGDGWWPASILCRAYVKAGRAKEIEAAIAEITRRNPAMLPRLLDAWAGAVSDDDHAWTELENLLDNPHLVGHERTRRFRDYARKLAQNDRTQDAIAVLERALSPRQRLLVSDVHNLYEHLVHLYATEARDRENELLGPITVPARIVGLWDKPLALCRRYVDEAPFSPRPHLLLAETYRDAGQSRDAEAAYRRALELSAEPWARARAISGLTEILLAFQRADEAVDYLRDPDYLRNELHTRIALIDALAKAGRQEEAGTTLDEMFVFLSRRSYWWGGRETQEALLSVVKALEGEAGAMPRIEAAFDRDPSSGPLARILIDHYRDTKQFAKLTALAGRVGLSTDRGRECLDRVLDALRDAGEHQRRAQVALDIILSGGLPREYHLRWLSDICVDASREAGTLNEMGVRVEAEFAKDPASVAIGFLLARLYEAADRRDDAVRVYADLADKYPADRTIVDWLFSRAPTGPEHDQVVLPHLERAVLREPRHAIRHAQFAGVLGRAQRDQEAAAQYAIAFQTEDNPLQMRHLSDEFAVHGRLGTTADLVKRYEQFAADWPEDPVAHLVLAMAYRQAQRQEDAVAQLNRASELAGGRRDVLGRLVEVFRELGMADRALAELKTLIDSSGRDHERLESLREYVRVCREMKRYHEAIAAIDEVIPDLDPEGWMVGELMRLRDETTKAMQAEPPPPHRLRLSLSVRRLWECHERDLHAGTHVASQAQAVFEGEVVGEAGAQFSYEALMDIAAPGAVGDGTTVLSCEADRCQARGGGMLPLPGGQASFRHAVNVDEGTASNPADACLVTRSLAPIAGGRRRCTIGVRTPWAARVALVFPAGASIVGDAIEGAQRDGDRFVAALAEPGGREFAAVVTLDAGVTDYAPEVVIERVGQPHEVANSGTMSGIGLTADVVTGRLRAGREFTLDHGKTEVRWALRMAPIVESRR